MEVKWFAIILSILLGALTMTHNAAHADGKSETTIFAGGCFWCMEPPFEELDGVTEVTAGYTGGHKKNPTYEEVSSGRTGHMEAVLVTYDPSRITYRKLLDTYWKQINPTDSLGQFADRGSQYKTAIFYYTDEQKRIAEESKKELERSGRFVKPIVTEILKASTFYKAEDYHQDYYKSCPVEYDTYKKGSGRVEFIKKNLTPLQYKVTQECGTEPPFNNEYWDNKKEGIYVDIVSGEPLFSSTDKFESGTGWPSFTKPLESKNIKEKEDDSLSMKRMEVRSAHGDSHLGHVFDDGPAPTGERYCINSSALRFIPKADLKKEGYGEYSKLFKEK